MGSWIDLSINEDVPKLENFSYLLEAQARVLNHSNYYELGIMQAALGYRKMPKLSFWLGYEWIGHNNIFDIPRQNGIWQQMVWQVYTQDHFTFRTRTQFEQVRPIDNSQWASFFREKFSFYFQNTLMDNKWTPLIYDEIFVLMNNPNWLDGVDKLAQNRLFIGVDIPTSKTTFVEIGYLQQALFNDSGNILNHTLYIGFNINTDSLPLAQYVR